MRDTGDITVRPMSAAEAIERTEDLAGLRIRVFRDFPYLYDGDMAYERNCLAKYMESRGAVIIGAFDGDALIGAATGTPLTDHFEAFAEPFRQRGWAPEAFFYFGESVLLHPYRSRGVGVRFFVEREKAALQQGFAHTIFSAVVRPPGHPARPDGYVPLDRFWQARGYSKVEKLKTHFSWRDIGDANETEKEMEYWMKDIGGMSAPRRGR